MDFFVDTKKVKENYKLLDDYINDYQNNGNDIFFELSKINSYWHGIDADNFIDLISNQKKNDVLILSLLSDISSIYKNIDVYYDKINNNEK